MRERHGSKQIIIRAKNEKCGLWPFGAVDAEHAHFASAFARAGAVIAELWSGEKPVNHRYDYEANV